MKQIDTIILVEDIKRSKKFYSEIIQLEVLHDWVSMVIFRNRFAIHQTDLLQPKDLIGPLLENVRPGSSNFIIYVGTDSIESEFERLGKLGVDIVHGIVELPWQRIFRIRDDNGYLVEIGEEKDT